MPRIVKYCFLEPNKEIEIVKNIQWKKSWAWGREINETTSYSNGQIRGAGYYRVFFLSSWNSNPLQWFHPPTYVPPRVAESNELWFKQVMKWVITFILRKSFPHSKNLLPFDQRLEIRSGEYSHLSLTRSSYSRTKYICPILFLASNVTEQSAEPYWEAENWTRLFVSHRKTSGSHLARRASLGHGPYPQGACPPEMDAQIGHHNTVNQMIRWRHQESIVPRGVPNPAWTDGVREEFPEEDIAGQVVIQVGYWVGSSLAEKRARGKVYKQEAAWDRVLLTILGSAQWEMGTVKN